MKSQQPNTQHPASILKNNPTPASFNPNASIGSAPTSSQFHHNQFNQPASPVQHRHHYQPPPPAPTQHHSPHYNPYQQPRSPVVSPSMPRSGGNQRSGATRHARGSALFNQTINPSAKMPACAMCYQVIRGPFISAVGREWCPNHFVCAQPSCGINLQDVGFVEENGKLYCEMDYERYFAPVCSKCQTKILGEVCYALDRTFHSECFVCGKCKQKIGSGTFHIEDGVPYCTRDFNALFATKCAGCEFPIEAGDKFLDAINQKWHVECFICTTCNVPLTNTGFATKGNKPYCKKHAY